jgi:hypothetical protein
VRRARLLPKPDGHPGSVDDIRRSGLRHGKRGQTPFLANHRGEEARFLMRTGMFFVKKRTFLIKTTMFLVKTRTFPMKTTMLLVKTGTFPMKTAMFFMKTRAIFMKTRTFLIENTSVL